MITEQCFCQSYYNENGIVDCTCGKCDDTHNQDDIQENTDTMEEKLESLDGVKWIKTKCTDCGLDMVADKSNEEPFCSNECRYHYETGNPGEEY